MATLFYPSQAAHCDYAAQSQGPPSPPMDDSTRCSLPSISNLLDLADQGSPTSDTQPDFSFGTQPSRPSTRPSSSHYSSLRSGVLPPTPPATSEASFGGYDSPSVKSVNQLPRASGYYFEATPPPQCQSQQHQHHYGSVSSCSSHDSMLDQPMPMTTTVQSTTSRHASPVNRHLPPHRSLPMVQTSSASSYTSSASMPPAYYPQPQVSALYYQRSLPQTFPPQPSPWQHHHYISPAAAAAFPQSQDRYVCATCSKAFSRPSSLRIHSHSHTGEKPFKCPHAGCGKAFSVRSNMKRHERGCHNYDGN